MLSLSFPWDLGLGEEREEELQAGVGAGRVWRWLKLCISAVAEAVFEVCLACVFCFFTREGGLTGR